MVIDNRRRVLKGLLAVAARGAIAAPAIVIPKLWMPVASFGARAQGLPLLMSAGNFQNSWTQTPNANSATWDGFNIREVIANAAILRTAAVAKFLLFPPTSGANFVAASMWIGLQGASAPDFDGNQKQATVLGTNGFTLTAGGGTTLTDPVTFNLNNLGSGNVVVSFGITSGDKFRLRPAAASYTEWFKAASSASAGSTSNAGMSLDGTNSLSVCGQMLVQA